MTTRHFSDPYVASVYAAIAAARTGLQTDELLAECPEDEEGELRAALKELRDAGAISSASGRYMTTEGAANANALMVSKKERAKRRAVQPFEVEETLGTDLAPAELTQIKEITMPKKPQHGRASSIEPRILELFAAGPCLLETLIAADAGQNNPLSLKQGVARLRQKGEVVKLGGTSHRAVYGLKGTKISVAELAAIEIAAKGAAPGKAAKKATKKAATKAARQKKLNEIRATGKATAKKSAAKRAKAAAGPRSHYDPIRPGAKTARPAAAVPAPVEGFRVGLFNDGTLAIHDDDCEMQLDTAKTRALFAYLDTFQAMFGVAA